MSTGFAVVGWAVAAMGIALAVRWRRRLAWRSECVARACHEVRGPLAAARLGLTLGERVGRLSAARLRALDQELERAARALADLEAARRGAPAPEPASEAVDLEGLLADSVTAWQPAAAARGVELRLRRSGPPVAVCGDRVRLAQAVGNLIANAIEHGESPVEVRGGIAGDDVRVEVWDGGPGLDAPVSQLVRRRRRADRGRGLAIAGAVAAAHGGRLTSAPSDSGARLVLTLPRQAADSPAQAHRS